MEADSLAVDLEARRARRSPEVLRAWAPAGPSRSLGATTGDGEWLLRRVRFDIDTRKSCAFDILDRTRPRRIRSIGCPAFEGMSRSLNGIPLVTENKKKELLRVF